MLSRKWAFYSGFLGLLTVHSSLVFGVSGTWSGTLWISSGNGDWANNGNWVGNIVPPNDNSETATFPTIASPSVSVTFPVGFATVTSLTINSDVPYTISAETSGPVLVLDTITLNNPQLNIGGTAGHRIAAPVQISGLPLVVSQSGSSPFTISGDISGSQGILYNGPSVMILSGSNSYPSLAINAGTVSMNNASSLSGAVTNSGELQLGIQSGEITSYNASSFAQGTGGTLTLDYNSPNAFSQLLVSGATTLNGTLAINAPTTATPSTVIPITILQAGSLSGSFSNAQQGQSFIINSNLIGNLNYFSNMVTMNVAPAVSAGQLATLNAMQVASAVSANQNYMFISGEQTDLRNTVRKARSGSSCGVAFNGSGETRSSYFASENSGFKFDSSRLIASNDFVTDAGWDDEEDWLAALDSDINQTKEQQQSLSGRIGPAPQRYRNKFYIGPIGTTGVIKGEDFWASGVQAGIDHAFTEFGVGGLLQYEHTSGKGFLLDQATGNLYAVYVPKKIPELTVNGILGYSYEWFLMQARKGFDHDMNTAKGTPRGSQVTSLLGIEYTFDKRLRKSMPTGLQVSPYAALQYTRNHVDGFTEHGAGAFDSEVKSTTTNGLRSTLELYVQYTKRWKNFNISPEVAVGWQRQLWFEATNFRFRPVGSDGSFSSSKVKRPGNNYAIALIDLQMYFYKRYGIEASWNFEWNKLYHDSQFYVGFNLLF